MDLHLKNFKEHSEYEDFKESEEFKDPNVSQCEKEFHVHYSDISAATSITISETALTVNIEDETVQLTAELTPAIGDVIWKSNNPNIATVDNNGLVTLKALGDVSIWAFSPNGKERARCLINCIEIPSERIELNAFIVQLERGDEFQLEATVYPEGASQKVIWTTSNPSIATVDENGNITVHDVGECTITASQPKYGTSASCVVTVIGATGVTLNKDYISIIPEETMQLIATVTPSTAPNKDVTWSSSDESIATVDANGLVSGITTGTCIITVTTVDGGKTDTCEVAVKKDYSKEYFQITAFEPSEAKFTVYSPGTGFFPQINIQYRVNSAATWSSWTSSQWSPTLTVPLQSNDTVEFKGAYTANCGRFSSSTGKFLVAGNVMSLSNSEDFRDKKTLDDEHFFSSLFSGCTALESAEDLILPATALTDYCYSEMFNGCTNLKRAPKLKATTLAEGCYSGMFSGCASLTATPELPATTMFYRSYNNMFNGCTSLTTAPELIATTLAGQCYHGMFKGCTNLTEMPELPATTLETQCYHEMFSNCTSLTMPKELIASNVASNAYEKMFAGCTNLTQVAPMDTVTNIDTSGCKSMYSGCTSLTETAELPNLTTIGTSGLCYMYSDCNGITKAYKIQPTTVSSGCCEGMFTNCTSLNDVPTDMLPATTAATRCYYGMFSGCTSLVDAPALPATTLAQNCYRRMFDGCTSLVNAPALPATTLDFFCYNHMFNGCTSLVTAPELPATNFPRTIELSESGSYDGMFTNCSSLNYIKCHMTDKPSQGDTYLWLSGANGPGNFYCKSAFSSQITSRNGTTVPDGWTIIEF